MVTITEDYVSFEIAKLLKEKGFKGDCIMDYIDNELMNVYDDDYPSMYELENTGDDVVNDPTLQMAMKWLREVHKLYINVCPCVEGYYWTEKWHSYVENLKKRYPFGRFICTSDSCEQATEAAIKYCLEHLI